MSNGRIEYARLNGTHIFKIVGEVRAHRCISLDRLLHKIDQDTVGQGHVIGAVVDLTETTFVDSTVLGVLAKLGLTLKQRYNVQAFMLSTNPDITTLANSMGLNQVFTILNCCSRTPMGCTKELADEPCSSATLLDTVLDAHRTLMQLNDHNKNMFETLVNQLQKEKHHDTPSHYQIF